MRWIRAFHCWIESILFDAIQNGIDIDRWRFISDKKQIQILVGFQFAFPFVFDCTHTFKLCQSFFDLIRSVASQDLQFLIHARHVQNNTRLNGIWRF